jgi:hypothetical protein
MIVKTAVQFSVFLVNKPGVLSGVTARLADDGVNVFALAMMDSVENGVLRFVCDAPDQAKAALANTGEHWSETDVLIIEMPNQPGLIAQVAKTLSDAHISVSYAYVTGGAGDGITNAVFKVSETQRAFDLLTAV